MSDNPLRKAHALSAEASVLLSPSQPAQTVETLTKARDTYLQAAELFEKAIADQSGGDEKKTLTLLVNQHKKLAKDVERRIAAAQRVSAAVAAAAASGPSSHHDGSGSNDLTSGSGPRPTSRRMTSEGFSPKREAVGLASAAGISAWPAGISSRVGPPPFALRPPGMPPSLPRSVTSPVSASTPRTPGDQFARSPMHSSSSSDESYLNLGAIPDTLDPFSRFWGMLENMLDDISNPVAFASAPLGIDANIPGPREGPSALLADRRDGRPKDRSSKREKETARDPSPAESFYLVHNSKGSNRSSSPGIDSKAQTINGKTPEELALENDNLRKSLDEIASHAEKLERANKALLEQHDEREKAMKSIVIGVRREAQKVKHGQDMIRSQLLASQSHPPRSARPSSIQEAPERAEDEGEPALRSRIAALEAEVARLKGENEKQKGQTDKYRDKLHQIKASAKAKRDAKLAGEAKAGSSKRDPDEV